MQHSPPANAHEAPVSDCSDRHRDEPEHVEQDDHDVHRKEGFAHVSLRTVVTFRSFGAPAAPADAKKSIARTAQVDYSTIP